MSGLLSGMGSTLSANDDNAVIANDDNAVIANDDNAVIANDDNAVINSNYSSEFSLTITPRAELKATSMLAEKGHPDGLLRIYVVGGGCSGWQYGMAISDEIESEDVFIESSGGARIIVDQESAPMLAGAEIDYVEDLMKSGFNIYNPNAVASCACGTSFQTSGHAGTPRPC